MVVYFTIFFFCVCTAYIFPNISSFCGDEIDSISYLFFVFFFFDLWALQRNIINNEYHCIMHSPPKKYQKYTHSKLYSENSMRLQSINGLLMYGAKSHSVQHVSIVNLLGFFFVQARVYQYFYSFSRFNAFYLTIIHFAYIFFSHFNTKENPEFMLIICIRF